MKKYICISTILIIFTIILCGCGNKKKIEEGNLKQKVNTEILYIENELIIMANKLNNINYINYSVVTEQTGGSNQDKDETKQSEEGNSKQNSEDSKSQSTEQTKNENESNESQVYEIMSNNILERNKTINWTEEKNKIEKLYSTLPVICTDLKELGISTNEVEFFTSNIDNLAQAVINEQEKETLNNIVTIYGLFPEYMKKYDGESKKQKIINIKYLALLCYRDVTNDEWDNLEEDLNNLKLNYSNIKLHNDFLDKDINVKKGESIIEEMKNCINNKNKDIFFVKYKNFMQEVNLLAME